MSSDLDVENHEILNILKEMLEDSKEFENVIPKFKKNSEVKKGFTSGLTTAENRLWGYFCSETSFNLSTRYGDKSSRKRFRFCPNSTLDQ